MAFRSTITARELGELLGISARRLAEMRAAGRLPMTPDGTRIDGRALVQRGIAALAAGNRVPSREPSRRGGAAEVEKAGSA
jgi:hypothetical protein